MIIFTGKITGPIKPKEYFESSYWETAWYNNTISCIKITKVNVQYMNGTSYTYVKELSRVLDPENNNDCN